VVDLVVLVVGMDFAMYWLHRLAHLKWLYLVHRPHHRYVDPRPLTLFVLSPMETVAFGGLWLAFLCVYSPSWIAVVAYLTLNVFSGVIGHTGVELFPPFFERARGLRWIAGSAFHADHHASETCNYGFYTNVWDRMFGTHRPRAEAPAGVPAAIERG
jgi:sterol desaturase/sphingolipid hydroxylase (fatty acid hydroxylase superfamily)